MSNDSQDAHVPSRRDALKAVGGVAVGAASLWAAAAAASENIAGASEHSHVVSVPTTIAISVNGVALTNVTDVTSVARSVAVVQSSGSAGARNSPGPRAASSISFSREWNGDKTFQSWFETSVAGKADRRTVTVSILGKRGSILSLLELTGVWPTGWNGPSWDAKTMGSAHATESITCVYESFDYKK